MKSQIRRQRPFALREVVLGNADVTQLSGNIFHNELSSLLSLEKHLTAAGYVAKNADAAEQMMWERWAIETDSQAVRFVAEIVSQNIKSQGTWNSMLEAAKRNPIIARNYHLVRSDFVHKLQSDTVSENECEKLRVSAQQVSHRLATLDSMRLIALRELVSGSSAWAESMLLQAIELAEQEGDFMRAAEMWLLVAANASSSKEATTTVDVAWTNAVNNHAAAQTGSTRPLNLAFWLKADRQRPGKSVWPDQMRVAMLSRSMKVGCRLSTDSRSDLVFWSAVASAQYDNGEPQLALVSFKKAETFAIDDDVMWLRIAQGKCLAAVGQIHAATALLSGPTASRDPAISAASTAALGSSKLQAGAYQQGAQLLSKALYENPTLQWPTRIEAKADLALAQLIIGDTEQALDAMHAVQKEFQLNGDLIPLLQTLDNEASLLEHEGGVDAAKDIRLRIRQIENS